MLKVEPIASVTIYSYTFASLSVDLLQSSLLVDIQIATWLNNYHVNAHWQPNFTSLC